MADLDELDRRLLALLRGDGRAPVAVLARRLGVARATVTARIERLQRQGVIEGFTVVVAADAGTGAVRAITHLAIEGRRMNSVVDRLRGMPEITRLHTTNGEWDLVCEITVPDLAEVDRVLGRIRAVDGVRHSETSLLLRDVLP